MLSFSYTKTRQRDRESKKKGRAEARPFLAPLVWAPAVELVRVGITFPAPSHEAMGEIAAQVWQAFRRGVGRRSKGQQSSGAGRATLEAIGSLSHPSVAARVFFQLPPSTADSGGSAHLGRHARTGGVETMSELAAVCGFLAVMAFGVVSWFLDSVTRRASRSPTRPGCVAGIPAQTSDVGLKGNEVPERTRQR